MRTILGFVFSIIISLESYFIVHIYAGNGGSLFNERPIEKVTVIRCDNSRSRRLDVLEKMNENGSFVGSIDNCERAFEFGFWSVVKVVNISRNNFTIRDEEALTLSRL